MTVAEKQKPTKKPKPNQLGEKEVKRLPIVGRQPENEKEAEYLNEVCEFEFYNLEQPGLEIKFPYGSTNKRHTFTFAHGKRYSIPRHVARHVESCATPIKQFAHSPDGRSRSVQIVGQKPRFQMRHIYSGAV